MQKEVSAFMEEREPEMVIRKMPQRLFDERLLRAQPAAYSAEGNPVKRPLHYESDASLGASLLNFW